MQWLLAFQFYATKPRSGVMSLTFFTPILPPLAPHIRYAVLIRLIGRMLSSWLFASKRKLPRPYRHGEKAGVANLWTYPWRDSWAARAQLRDGTLWLMW